MKCCNVINMELDLTMLRHIIAAVRAADDNGFDDYLDGDSLNEYVLETFGEAADVLDELMLKQAYGHRST